MSVNDFHSRWLLIVGHWTNKTNRTDRTDRTDRMYNPICPICPICLIDQKQKATDMISRLCSIVESLAENYFSSGLLAVPSLLTGLDLIFAVFCRQARLANSAALGISESARCSWMSRSARPWSARSVP